MIGTRKEIGWLIRILVLAGTLFQGSGASSQSQPKLRLLMTICNNKSIAKEVNIADRVTDVLFTELTNPLNPGLDKYVIVSKQEEREARIRLRLEDTEKGGKPDALKPDDLLRLAQELKVDAILKSDTRAFASKRGSYKVGVELRFIEMVSQMRVVGGSTIVTAKTLDQAVEQAVKKVVTFCLQQKILRGVLQQIDEGEVTLSVGSDDGVSNGDFFCLLSEVDGPKRKVGLVLVRKVYAKSAIADKLTIYDKLHLSDTYLSLKVPASRYFIP